MIMPGGRFPTSDGDEDRKRPLSTVHCRVVYFFFFLPFFAFHTSYIIIWPGVSVVDTI